MAQKSGKDGLLTRELRRNPQNHVQSEKPRLTRTSNYSHPDFSMRKQRRFFREHLYSSKLFIYFCKEDEDSSTQTDIDESDGEEQNDYTIISMKTTVLTHSAFETIKN